MIRQEHSIPRLTSTVLETDDCSLDWNSEKLQDGSVSSASSSDRQLEEKYSPTQDPGRRRPEAFKSTWMEILFATSVLASLAMTEFIISGFQVVLPALTGPLNISPAQQTWPSSILTLVAGSFLFPMGRLADMYGGYLLFNGGVAWFSLWTLVAGFSQNITMLIFCRAMEGLGAAAFLPAGVSILGRVYSPGPRKNLIFSLYGALAPIGFFAGLVFGGAADELLNWRWFFWLGSILSGVACIGSILTSPRDYAEARRQGHKMDWYGVCTIVPGIVLVIYAITASSGAAHGWASPEVLVTLFLGITLLAVAVYLEGWKASSPLVPASMFKIKYMKRMLSCLILIWGTQSTFLFYVNFYIERIAGESTLVTSSWFAPWAIGGAVLSTATGFMLHIISGRILLVSACACKIIAVLLFALMPAHPNYWAWVMPAMTAEAACIDVLWTVSNVFLTASLPRDKQGLAGSVINIVVLASGSLFLGIADVAINKFRGAGLSLKDQYQDIFWVGVGTAGLATVISCFINIGKADSATSPRHEILKDNRSEITLVDDDVGSSPETLSTVSTVVDTELCISDVDSLKERA